MRSRGAEETVKLDYTASAILDLPPKLRLTRIIAAPALHAERFITRPSTAEGCIQLEKRTRVVQFALRWILLVLGSV